MPQNQTVQCRIPQCFQFRMGHVTVDIAHVFLTDFKKRRIIYQPINYFNLKVLKYFQIDPIEV